MTSPRPSRRTGRRAILRGVPVAVLLLVAVSAHAQTATPVPTDTPTPTNTPTVTPTTSVEGALASGFTCGAGGLCPTPPCDYTTHPNSLPVLHPGVGHKTADLAMPTPGSATVKLMCNVRGGYGATPILLSSLTGASCDTTAANCMKEFDTFCEDVFVRVTACPTPATIYSHLANDKGGR